MTPYCTNSQCKKREHCKNSDTEIKGKHAVFFFSHEKECERYECIHKVWRRYDGDKMKECDQCHAIIDTWGEVKIQHQR